ncbi:IniB N-terminal domain-containing protein [Arthrobacter sp. C152]
MPTLANDLVQFLMHLFGNPEAARDFLEDPERALSDHGLGHVTSADVDAAMPVVLDYAPISVNAAFDRDEHTGSNGAGTGHSGWTGPVALAGNGGAGAAGGPGGGSQEHEDHAYAVQQLHHVMNHYSYTAGTTMVDDRDTITDQSVTQNIWAHGDVEQWFDNDAAVAPGDQAVTAVVSGGDADARDASTTGDTYNTDVALDMEAAWDGADHSAAWDGADHFAGTEMDGPFSADSSVDSLAPEPDAVNQAEAFDTPDAATTQDAVSDAGTSIDAAADGAAEDTFQDHPDTVLVEDDAAAAGNPIDFPEDTSSHTGADMDQQAAIDDPVLDGPVIDDSAAL